MHPPSILAIHHKASQSRTPRRGSLSQRVTRIPFVWCERGRVCFRGYVDLLFHDSGNHRLVRTEEKARFAVEKTGGRMDSYEQATGAPRRMRLRSTQHMLLKGSDRVFSFSLHIFCGRTDLVRTLRRKRKKGRERRRRRKQCTYS